MACLFVFFLDWYISVVKFQSMLTKKQVRLQFHNMPAAGEHQFIGWRSWISVLDIYLNQPCLQAEDMKLLVSYTSNWLLLSFNLGGGNSNMFYFHPEPWGNDPISRAYLSHGLVQPPPSEPDASPPRGKLPRYSGGCEITQQREAHLCGAGGGLSKVVTRWERVVPMVKSWAMTYMKQKKFRKNPVWTILCWNTSNWLGTPGLILKRRRKLELGERWFTQILKDITLINFCPYL